MVGKRTFLIISLGLGIVAFQAWSMINEARSNQAAFKQIEQELKSLSEEIKPPADFRVIQEPRQLVLINSGTLSARYQSQMQCNEVKNYYSSLLPTENWEFKEESSLALKDLEFKKENYRIEIECSGCGEQNCEKEYAVTVSYKIIK